VFLEIGPTIWLTRLRASISLGEQSVFGDMSSTSMSFSKHVGLEPASDLKKQIQALCLEAGFEVAGAEMHMLRQESLQESVRVILVWIREPGWSMTTPAHFAGKDRADFQMEVRAIIGVNGAFDGTVRVACAATDMIGDMFVPTLRTNQTQLGDLPPFLLKVAKQQREIIVARKARKKGPWRFDDMHWKEFKG
jgi:hypothetical protein